MAEYDVVCLVRGERVPVTVYFDSTVAYLRKTFAAHYGIAPDRPPRLIWRGALLRDLDATTEQPTTLKDVGIVEEGNAVQVSLLPDSYDPEHQQRLQVCTVVIDKLIDAAFDLSGSSATEQRAGLTNRANEQS